MNRPADGAAGLHALLSCSCAPAPRQMCAATHRGRNGIPRRMTPREGLGGRHEGTPACWGLLTTSFTRVHPGGRGDAVATWLPCEIPAKFARSSLHLLLKGTRQASKGFLGGYLFSHLKMHLKFYSDGPSPQSAEHLPLSFMGWDHAPNVGRLDCPDMTTGIP